MMPSADTLEVPKRFIDPSAAPVAPLPDFARDPGELINLYRAMVLTSMLAFSSRHAFQAATPFFN
jgi:hypothetical protein